MMRSTLLFFTLLGVTLSAPSPAQENESVDHQSEFTIMSPINILSDVMKQFEDIFRIIFDKFGNYTNMNVTTWEVLQVNGTPYFLNTTITEGKKSPHVTVHFSTLAYSKSHKNESKDEMGKDKKKKE
ncbi:uncharacterized protein LOC111641667 [Centruroides sculpturatus]|uniref:uncharacterized protein LOC111641666 n=1 Tax=Centruroides sculpturatus TaxID=218467 RepID=UPI000C6DB494|nr:uncharacterized protein LOC111641666 [Centruroides sculpturatus]XP_023243638.1 uncharacterized protein LOC111641667 [Centruroides sculpturatus]